MIELAKIVLTLKASENFTNGGLGQHILGLNLVQMMVFNWGNLNGWFSGEENSVWKKVYKSFFDLVAIATLYCLWEAFQCCIQQSYGLFYIDAPCIRPRPIMSA